MTMRTAIPFIANGEPADHKPKPYMVPKNDRLQLRDHIAVREMSNGVDTVTVAEYIGTGNFGRDFIYRQQYEVEAGREQEPLVFEAIYDVVRDASLPKHIDIDVMGPGGFIFEKVKEGGEVRFATVSSSAKTVSIERYAAGIEYTQDLIDFNQMWRLARLERRVGLAHNALLNNIHISPILSFSYQAANQTAASSAGSSLVEKYIRTIEDAVTNSQEDTTNPRFGPYVLLIAPGDRWMVERALLRVPQEGFTLQSSVINDIRSVIVYNGWTGTRGKKSTTYTGVAAGTAYLISLANQMLDFQSYIKADLMRTDGDIQKNKFIAGSDIWFTQLGVFANPVAAVEEITWPTS